MSTREGDSSVSEILLNMVCFITDVIKKMVVKKDSMSFLYHSNF